MERNIKIFIDSSGELWSTVAEMRPATEEDVECWGDEYDVELGDLICVFGEDDFGLYLGLTSGCTSGQRSSQAQRPRTFRTRR